MSNQTSEEKGAKWWLTKVIVPLFGSGGIVAILVAVLTRIPPPQTASLPSPTFTVTATPHTPTTVLVTPKDTPMIPILTPTLIPTPLVCSGRVIDASTGNTIEGAKVALDLPGVPSFIYTDNEGIYRFTLPADIKQLSSRVWITAEGYERYNRLVSVSPAETDLEDIRLTPFSPTPTPTSTPAFTPTPSRTGTATTAPTSTLTNAPTIAPTACPYEPEDIFHNIWEKHKSRLGCAHTISAIGGKYVEQPFERGHMFYSEAGRLYLVIVGEDSGTWQHLSEAEVQQKREQIPLANCPAVMGRPKDGSGFEAIWCTDSKLRTSIGVATDHEREFHNVDLHQAFEGGIILRDSDGFTNEMAYILFSNNMSFVREPY